MADVDPENPLPPRSPLKKALTPRRQYNPQQAVVDHEARAAAGSSGNLQAPQATGNLAPFQYPTAEGPHTYYSNPSHAAHDYPAQHPSACGQQYPQPAPPSQQYPQYDPSKAYAGQYSGHPQQYAHAEPAPVIVVVQPQAADASNENYVMRAERIVRAGFLRKVYSILAIQMLVLFGIVSVFTFVQSVKEGVQARPGVIWSAVVLSLIFFIALACFPKVSKRWPLNICLLCGFTLCQAYFLGALASFFRTDAVLMAIGGTVCLVVGLTLFAWQTRINFTRLTGFIFVLLLTVLMFGIVAAIAPLLIFRTLYAALGVLLFGIFLVYDTQMIVGGLFGIDDAINAALMLFVDLIQIFVCLLALFGSRD